MLAPHWLEAGLAELDTKLVALFHEMQAKRPTTELRHLFLQTLDALHDLRELATRLAPVDGAASAVISPQEAPQELQVAEHEELVASPPIDGKLVGMFRRRPRGGVLVAESGMEIDMTEGQVKILEDRCDLLDGDLLAAKDEGFWPGGKRRWFFTVLEHRGTPNQDRIVTFGTVERWDSYFFCIKRENLCVLLEPKDIRYHDVKEGAVVEFAYLESEVKNTTVAGYILRKLDGEDFAPLFETSATAAPRAPRRAPTPESATLPLQFVGEPTVLVIGGRNWPHFRDGLTEFGARPSYLDGFDNNQNLESKLRGYDLVIVVKTAASHAMSDRAKGIVPKDRLYVTSYENWSGFRNRLLIPTIIPAWNTMLVPVAD